MTIVLAIDTVALVLLTLLVAGVLRSHAELLRRTSETDRRRPARASATEPTFDPRLPPVAGERDSAIAPVLRGSRLDGAPVEIALGPHQPNTVLAFLSSGCTTCQNFWDAFADPTLELPRSARLVIVTKDSDYESPSQLAPRAPRDVPLVMSSEAWTAYDVPVSPYFVYVDGPTAEIMGEGAASTWPQVTRLLEDAIADLDLAQGTVPRVHVSKYSDSHPDRIREADSALEAAGIGPDHPSLWPARRPSPTQSVSPPD
jgi:hypothetical protein